MMLVLLIFTADVKDSFTADVKDSFIARDALDAVKLLLLVLICCS